MAADAVFSWLSQGVANVEGIWIMRGKQKKGLAGNSSKERHWKGGGIKPCSPNVDPGTPCDKQSHALPKAVHPEPFAKITSLGLPW